jgi:hypothetical protein
MNPHETDKTATTQAPRQFQTSWRVPALPPASDERRRPQRNSGPCPRADGLTSQSQRAPRLGAVVLSAEIPVVTVGNEADHKQCRNFSAEASHARPFASFRGWFFTESLLQNHGVRSPGFVSFVCFVVNHSRPFAPACRPAGPCAVPHLKRHEFLKKPRLNHEYLKTPKRATAAEATAAQSG